MPNNSYEFGYISPREKKKILISKLFLAILIFSSFHGLIADPTADLSSDLISVGGILSAIFGYINILRVKSELMELFEPPYSYVGYEFVIAGTIASTASFFV